MCLHFTEKKEREYVCVFLLSFSHAFCYALHSECRSKITENLTEVLRMFPLFIVQYFGWDTGDRERQRAKRSEVGCNESKPDKISYAKTLSMFSFRKNRFIWFAMAAGVAVYRWMRFFDAKTYCSISVFSPDLASSNLSVPVFCVRVCEYYRANQTI